MRREVGAERWPAEEAEEEEEPAALSKSLRNISLLRATLVLPRSEDAADGAAEVGAAPAAPALSAVAAVREDWSAIEAPL